MAYGRLSGERGKFSRNDAHHGCLAFSVASHESDFLPTFYFDIGVAEDDFVAIADCEPGSFEGNVATPWRCGEPDIKGCIVGFVYLYPLQFVKGPDPLLHLLAFCGFVSEGADKFLGLLYHPLLVFIGGGLLLHPFLAQLYVFGIGNLIVVYVPQHDFHGAVGHVVEEFPVVRNEQNRTAIPLQIVFQPLYRLYVKMVGGLIEKKQVRPG